MATGDREIIHSTDEGTMDTEGYALTNSPSEAITDSGQSHSSSEVVIRAGSSDATHVTERVEDTEGFAQKAWSPEEGAQATDTGGDTEGLLGAVPGSSDKDWQGDEMQGYIDRPVFSAQEDLGGIDDEGRFDPSLSETRQGTDDTSGFSMTNLGPQSSVPGMDMQGEGVRSMGMTDEDLGEGRAPKR